MSGLMNEFDATVRGQYQAQGGFYGRESLPLQSFLWNDNGTLKALAATTTGTVGFAFFSDGTTTTGMTCLEWEATASQTDVLQRNWTIPDDYAAGGRQYQNPAIILRARVRKLDTGGATDNDNLQLKADIGIHSPSYKIQRAGSAAGASAESSEGAESDGDDLIVPSTGIVFKTIADQQANTAAASCYVPAMATAAQVEKTRWMEADITASLTQAQITAIKAGGTMGIKVYPSEAIGTAQALQITDLEVVYTRNLQPANKRIKALGGRHA